MEEVMTKEFEDSNGMRIRLGANGYLERMNPSGTGEWNEIGGLSPNASLTYSALREFFRHERDEELGRWRWPENPGYVVYPDGTSRRVVRESTGQTMQVSLHDRKAMTTYLDSYVGAAKAYDAAHEPPKPWHDAKPGEVWVVTPQGAKDAEAMTVIEKHGLMFSNPVDETYLSISGYITAARRIFPEATDG